MGIEFDKSEIGRKLNASELVEGTVVVLLRGQIGVTCWVILIDQYFAGFQMGDIDTGLILFREGLTRDQLIDATGQQVHVFEYLGEV